MPADFVIVRNAEPDSRLPYLLRIPLGSAGVLVKARETWPRTAAVYCHPADCWPDDAVVVERVATRSCVRRGAAIDLVLDRSRENRSQFVFTTARGRNVIFWQTARVTKRARPGVHTPSARAQGITRLMVFVDDQVPWSTWDPRWSPTLSQRRRYGGRRCRSCSARRASWPRNGPIATLPPPASSWPRTPTPPGLAAASPPATPTRSPDDRRGDARLGHAPRPVRCRPRPGPTGRRCRLPGGTPERVSSPFSSPVWSPRRPVSHGWVNRT